MENNQVKSFWEQPEGKTGKILVGLAIVLGAFAFIHFNVMGILAQLAMDTMKLMYSLAAIGVLGMVVTARRPRTMLFFALQSISRALTKIFVEIDPVGILRAFSKDMGDKRKTVQKAIESMLDIRQKASAQRDLKEREMVEAINNANAAQAMGNIEKLQELTEKAGRRKATIARLDDSIKFANDSIATLQRVDRVIEYHINTSNDEADELESNNEMALAELAATHAANEALGDTDKLTVRNMARDVINERTAKARASVEMLMENTRSIQGDMDLSNMAQMQEGMRMLQQLQASVGNAEAAQIGTKKPQQATARILTSGTDNTNIVPNRWADRLNVKKN